jgi:hypothetical protein|nr:MAG TPA: hypothetical protein [Caudoviricetes sp.]
MIRITRTTPTAETLQDIYRTIQDIFTDETYYYSKSELEELKKDPNNIILKIKGE